MYDPGEPQTPKSSSTIIVPIKQLRRDKPSVFLALDNCSDQKCIMKTYLFDSGKSNPGFIRESRLFGTLFPNLIRIIEAQDNLQNLKNEHFSCIISEYAPHGDLKELMAKHKIHLDQKLVRTIFHQIAQGIEHLHGRGISHLDLKFTHIHIGLEYKIKIGGFDQCHFNAEKPIMAKGTLNFRAPEIKKGECYNPRAADVYSMGILLFYMVMGHEAYTEDKQVYGFGLENLLADNDSVFWKVNSLTYKTESKNESFKKLLFGMCKKVPEERLSVFEIMHSEWYKGEIYEEKEFYKVMKKLCKSNKK